MAVVEEGIVFGTAVRLPVCAPTNSLLQLRSCGMETTCEAGEYWDVCPVDLVANPGRKVDCQTTRLTLCVNIVMHRMWELFRAGIGFEQGVLNLSAPPTVDDGKIVGRKLKSAVSNSHQPWVTGIELLL